MRDPSINADCLPLFDQIPFGLILLQKDLSIRFWNKILVDWTGIKKEDIIGKNLLDQYPQAQPAFCHCTLSRGI